MNIDASHAAGNCSGASSSRPGLCLPNGYSGRTLNYLSNDLCIPPGGFPSLRLPVVVDSTMPMKFLNITIIENHAKLPALKMNALLDEKLLWIIICIVFIIYISVFPINFSLMACFKLSTTLTTNFKAWLV